MEMTGRNEPQDERKLLRMRVGAIWRVRGRQILRVVQTPPTLISVVLDSALHVTASAFSGARSSTALPPSAAAAVAAAAAAAAVSAAWTVCGHVP